MTKQPRKFYKKLLTIFLIISIIPSIFIGIFSSIMVEIIIQNRLISESNKRRKMLYLPLIYWLINMLMP